MTKRNLWIAMFVAAVGLLGAACDCQLEDVDTVIEDFESCGGLEHCGWNIAGGTARLTPTFHSAKQGLELSRGASASFSARIRTEEIHVVSNCPRGMVLHLDGQPYRLSATTQDHQPWYRLAVVVSRGGDDVSSLAVENTNNRSCIIDDIRSIDDVCLEDDYGP